MNVKQVKLKYNNVSTVLHMFVNLSELFDGLIHSEWTRNHGLQCTVHFMKGRN
jgi:hypothetical protein